FFYMNDSGKMRLNKYLARAGITSRRKADKLIEQGRVRVNGKVVTMLGTKIIPKQDKVEVDGKTVKPEEKLYLMLNKPPGFLVTLDDPFNRLTIKTLLPDLGVRVFPVGRLDLNSEGLLLLTNDGELAHHLMHPRYNIKKVYMVRIKGQIQSRDLKELSRGVHLDNQRISPDKVKLIKEDSDTSLLKVEIHEGKKREIRRMFQSIGCQVVSLKRIQFAGLKLGNLEKGKWRYLTPKEIKILNYS
ncbi:MAG: pseudouridine synthase, partial [Candidatus Aminicenantes bacterium]